MGQLSSVMCYVQLAIPTESGVLQDTSLSVKQSLTSNASSNSADRASVPGKVSPRSAVAPRQTLKKGSTQENKPRQPSAPRSNVPRPTNSLPARPRRGAENRPAPDVYSQHIPAYMKSTASNKAKDAREAQAKLAAQRSVLTEKKWNRA